MCALHCAQLLQNIAQKRPDNFPSYPPNNHHCFDDVYLREGDGAVRNVEAENEVKFVVFRPLQRHCQTIPVKIDTKSIPSVHNSARQTWDVIDEHGYGSHQNSKFDQIFSFLLAGRRYRPSMVRFGV